MIRVEWGQGEDAKPQVGQEIRALADGVSSTVLLIFFLPLLTSRHAGLARGSEMALGSRGTHFRADWFQFHTHRYIHMYICTNRLSDGLGSLFTLFLQTLHPTRMQPLTLMVINANGMQLNSAVWSCHKLLWFRTVQKPNEMWIQRRNRDMYNSYDNIRKPCIWLFILVQLYRYGRKRWQAQIDVINFALQLWIYCVANAQKTRIAANARVQTPLALSFPHTHS